MILEELKYGELTDIECTHPECTKFVIIGSRGYPNQYCSRSCGNSHKNLGLVRTQITKDAISAAKLGMKHSLETCAAISKSLIGNTRAEGNTSGCDRIWSTNSRNKLSKSLSDAHARGCYDLEYIRDSQSANMTHLNNLGLTSAVEIHIVEGLKCQGSYEKWFVEELVRLGLSLPTKPEHIRTPTGSYTPDFEFSDFFVEIKSTYTLEKSKLDGQYEKILWVSDNIKPVVVINLDSFKSLTDYDYNLIFIKR